MLVLTDIEARVLGCLIEKQLTTPEYYPLSLNALMLACNQKNNRDPLVTYDDRTVVRGLDGLREKKLIWMVHSTGSRVPKYEHRLPETLPLPADQVAALCLLLLRGPQTAGEIRGRSGRLHSFAMIPEVEIALHQLSVRAEGALVVRLPLLPRSHEPRFAHLLCGEPVVPVVEVAVPAPEPARALVEAENARLGRIEEELGALRAEVADLKTQLAAFREQFQ
jgi:uncharacterized protein YceH (UPF0502 family)